MIATMLQTMRLPFLLLTPVCVLLGVAVSDAGSILRLDTLLVLIGALLAHISVNMLNEYQDFRSGLDLATSRTPFSGGSGGLPSDPESAFSVLVGALVALVAVGVIGLWLAIEHPALIPLGILGGVIIVTYTRQINRSPWLCLIAPGTGFGLIMVTGTALVAGAYEEWSVFFAGLLVFFLVNNLLLLNQFPDITADQQHGRAHLLIRYGTEAGVKVYGLVTLAAFLTIIVAVALSVWPTWALLALIPWAATLVSYNALKSLKGDIAQQPQAMGLNVMATLLTPLVISMSLLLS